jgi:hypothetical protein
VGDTWLRRLYIATSVIALAPIWSVRYLPTADGPSHVYNAWLIGELIRGNHLAQRWFTVDWRPYPNWTGHAVLAIFVRIFPPPIAEKLLVSGIVILFLCAIWRWSGVAADRRRECAFFAVPFAYHMLLQMGFYNFALGIALYVLTVAVWWDRRERTEARNLIAISLLLVACYFSHIMPALLAAASIGLLWLATVRGRPFGRHVRHLLVFVPVAPLFAYFAWLQRGSHVLGHAARRGLFAYIARMWVLVTFDAWQDRFGRFVFIILAALILITLVRRRWRWREDDAFVLLTIAIIVIYARVPDAAFGGSLLLERMALFVALSPLAWIAPRLPQRGMAALVVVLIAMSVVYTAYLTRRYRGVEKRIEEFVASARSLGSNTTLLPLVRDVRPAKGTFIPVLAHAIDYVAVEKRDIDIANYEATASSFPIRYVNDPQREACHRIVDLTTPVDLEPYSRCAEYVFAWHLSADFPLVTGLDRYYLPVGGTGEGTVYRVRDEEPFR